MGEDAVRLIQALDDGAAIELLARLAEAQPKESFQPTPGMLAALAEASPEPAVAAPADGEAARLALELLAGNAAYAAQIEKLVRAGPRRAFGIDPVTGMLLGTAILFVLQTHFEFERDKAGKWRVKVLKKPTKDGLIAPLIRKVMALVGVK